MSSWYSPEGYTIGYRPARPARGLATSPTELLHAGLAFVVLTFALAVVRSEFTTNGVFSLSTPSAVLIWIPTGALAALSGFLIHEMAHKVAAERYGFWAEFRMSPLGLMLAFVVVAVTGFIFAAPGATVVRGMGDRREWGLTSLAGPSVNLVEAAIFGGLTLSAARLGIGAWVLSLAVLTYLNAWWATFNLIPLGPLDGAKVWRWNKGVWAAGFVIGIVATIAIALPLFVGYGGF